MRQLYRLNFRTFPNANDHRMALRGFAMHERQEVICIHRLQNAVAAGLMPAHTPILAASKALAVSLSQMIPYIRFALCFEYRLHCQTLFL